MCFSRKSKFVGLFSRLFPRPLRPADGSILNRIASLKYDRPTCSCTRLVFFRHICYSFVLFAVPVLLSFTTAHPQIRDIYISHKNVLGRGRGGWLTHTVVRVLYTEIRATRPAATRESFDAIEIERSRINSNHFIENSRNRFFSFLSISKKNITVVRQNEPEKQLRYFKIEISCFLNFVHNMPVNDYSCNRIITFRMKLNWRGGGF